jgi:hypothetical protein
LVINLVPSFSNYFNQGENMIQQYTGVAAVCNLCQVPGPIIRADLNRFNRMGPDDLYTVQINRKVKAAAEKDGFITVQKYAPAPGLGAIQMQQQELHICPACSGQIKIVRRPKKSSSSKVSKETEE